MKQWPTIWGGNLIVQALVAIILWPYFSHATLLAWCASNYVLFAYRLRMRQRFESCIHEGHTTLRHWCNQYVLSAIIGGLIWGSASWLFFDSSDSETTLLLLTVLIGLSIGALPALSSYSPAFIAFTSAILLPTALRLATLEGTFAVWLSVLTLIFLIISIFYSRQLDNTISKSITIDLRNRALLEEVSAARNMAEKANRSKSSFLAAVSHDLRQPLHAMGLFMESLRSQLKEERQQTTFNNIETAHGALTKMFDALLEITRLESGTVTPVLTDFYLAQLLDDIENNFSTEAEQKDLDLKITCGQDIVVHTDHVLLFAIMSNLVSNAFKYTQRGSVHIECEEKDSDITIHVKDTGCGIPEESLDTIFEEYQQLENPERDAASGLGLGLAMVRRTCRLLDHPLEVDSTPERGSDFSLTIPRGETGNIIKDKPDITTRHLTGLHILVIDDDADIRTGIKEVLTQWDCLVTTSESDSHALIDLAEQKRPVDLLICDYRLRDKRTGIEAITAIRNKMDPELPALLITGDTDPELRNQLQSKGYRVLHKPVKPAQLLNIISALVK